MATKTEEKIREIAHKLWLDAGQPEGDELAHWLKAEEIASATPKRKPAAKKTTTTKATATKAAPAKAAADKSAPRSRAKKAA